MITSATQSSSMVGGALWLLLVSAGTGFRCLGISGFSGGDNLRAPSQMDRVVKTLLVNMSWK